MAVLNPGDRWGMPLSTPGSIPMADADGKLSWHENRPEPACGFQQAYTYGTTGVVWNLTQVGTGAVRTAQTSTPRISGIRQMETGTTTSGRVSVTATSTVALLADGATMVYEALVMVPTLPASGGDDFVLSLGVVDRADNAVSHGARFYLSSASIHWQAQTLQTTTSTTDTGVTCTAGVWYRMRLVMVGTSCTFYLIDDDTYHANGRSYGAAVVTDSSKDFSATAIFPVAAIIKTGGTTSRYLQYSFLNWTRTPTRSTSARAVVAAFASDLSPSDGFALPQALPGQRLLVDSVVRPYWDDYRVDTDNIPFFALESTFGGNMASITAGTGASSQRVNSTTQPTALRLITGGTSTGSSYRGLLDDGDPEFFGTDSPDDYAANSRIVYEARIKTFTSLSDGTNTFVQKVGFLDGVWFEFDANADTHWRVAYHSAVGESDSVTKTATTLVGNNSTEYWVRIVWQPVAGTGLGNDGGTAICTIGELGSNINTVSMTVNATFLTGGGFNAGAQVNNTAGTVSHSMDVGHQLVYQRFL